MENTHTHTVQRYSSNGINRQDAVSAVVYYIDTYTQLHEYCTHTHINVRRATAVRRAATASRATASLFVCYLRLMNQLIEIVLLLRTSRRLVYDEFSVSSFHGLPLLTSAKRETFNNNYKKKLNVILTNGFLSYFDDITANKENLQMNKCLIAQNLFWKWSVTVKFECAVKCLVKYVKCVC